MQKEIFLKYVFTLMIVIGTFLFAKNVYATLSCSITTAGACTDTVLLRMSSSTSAHAELPGQSTAVYDDNVVCCSGVTGLGSSCSGNYKVLARLSGVTNAHAERNTESGVNYTENACVSSIFGDIITVGYQASNCTGYNTTAFSMGSYPTNSKVGIPSAYNNKVCVNIFSQAISFSISTNTVGFGNLSTSALRYATGDELGSSSEVESYNIGVSTNAPYGYSLSVSGDTLTNGITVITPIGGTNTTPTIGTKSFGIRAVASGGSGTVVSPYAASGFAYDATGSTFSKIAEASTGDNSTTTYSIRTVSTIDSLTTPGNYATNLTYVVTATF